jgi:transposase
MRRTHLRGHENILKRLLIHAGGFNLGLLVRSILGVGTPRGLQGRIAAVIATMWVLVAVAQRRFTPLRTVRRVMMAMRGLVRIRTTLVVNSSAAATCATGC